MPNFIRLDLFPADATVNGETAFRASRVIVTDEEVYVYRDAPMGPEIAYQARLEELEGRRTIGYTLSMANGDSVFIKNASGCGCGSRLKGYHPFVGVPHVSTP